MCAEWVRTGSGENVALPINMCPKKYGLIIVKLYDLEVIKHYKSL